jgi:hypothetical protein
MIRNAAKDERAGPSAAAIRHFQSSILAFYPRPFSPIIREISVIRVGPRFFESFS